MIRPLKVEEAAPLSRLFLPLARSPESGCYPILETQEELESVLRRRAEQRSAFVRMRGPAAEGLLFLLLEAEKRYIQVEGIYALAPGGQGKEVLAELVDFFLLRYLGCSVDLGIRAENGSLQRILEERCFVRTEESIDFRLREIPCSLPAAADVIRMGAEERELLRHWHDRFFPEYYWNSERLLRAEDAWLVYFLLEDGCVRGELFARRGGGEVEIFGLVSEREGGCRLLLTRLLSELAQEALLPTEILFFVEQKDSERVKLAESFGFVAHSSYQLWQRRAGAS